MHIKGGYFLFFFGRHENEDETENYQHVEESDQTKFVNSATYGKKVRGSRWSAEETEEFYDVCLVVMKAITLLIRLSCLGFVPIRSEFRINILCSSRP